MQPLGNGEGTIEDYKDKSEEGHQYGVSYCTRATIEQIALFIHSHLSLYS